VLHTADEVERSSSEKAAAIAESERGARRHVRLAPRAIAGGQTMT
jgi:hypothetical protein